MSRKRRICYWDKHTNEITSIKAQFEQHLGFINDCTIDKIKSYDDPNFDPCDLLIINIIHTPHDKIADLIRNHSNRAKKSERIWTPAIFVSDVTFDELMFDVHDFAEDNWYFDILSPKHLDSIPIRLANLLKIHDHLLELQRYQVKINSLEEKVESIENLLSKG